MVTTLMWAKGTQHPPADRSFLPFVRDWVLLPIACLTTRQGWLQAWSARAGQSGGPRLTSRHSSAASQLFPRSGIFGGRGMAGDIRTWHACK